MPKKLNKWDRQHLINLGLTERQVDKIFDMAVKEAAAIGMSIHDLNPDKPFSFADYPQTKARIDKLIKSLQKNVETAIVNGVRSEWTLANNKNNALCDRVFGENKNKLSKKQERKYYNNNDKALEAFITRKTAGLNLSDRVWNYTDQFKAEIEMGLDLGIRNGLPATETARELKQYLREPDWLFRRVRDEHGQLHLSQAAKSYHPGAGVYRSSYKNAMRLARTENNMAYHTADYERWQQLDFVVGIEIRLSNNHTLNGKPFTDICDELQGKYPKNFKFTGWHPQCRCHAVTILKTLEELAKDNERILNGEKTGPDSVNLVKDVPDNFKKWTADNAERIQKANSRGTLPYFIKDNMGYVKAGRIEKAKIMDTLKGKVSYKDYYGGGSYEAPVKEEYKFDRAELEKRGFSFTDDEVDEKLFNEIMHGFNLDEFDDEMLELGKKYRVVWSDKLISYYGGDLINIEYYSHNRGVTLIRRYRKGSVSHSFFQMPKDMQGQGFSKEAFKILYKQYKNAGIERIDVHANLDVGGATWAKYGFVAKADSYNKLVSHINRSLNISKTITEEEHKEVMVWLETYKGKDIPLNEIVGKPYFTEMMKYSDWEGYIDFKDENQKKIFEAYLYKSKNQSQ